MEFTIIAKNAFSPITSCARRDIGYKKRGEVFIKGEI
jgi:hypothetical protein